MDNRDKIEIARDRVTESISKNMYLYGVTPSVGRLYGTMYFHDGPMTLDDMKNELEMSKTSMSSSVRVLTELKMVDKIWKKGMRKDFYSVEEDWYQTFIDLFCIKWRQGINMNVTAIEKSLLELKTILEDDSSNEEMKETVNKDVKKLNDAHEYYMWLQKLVDSFESGEIFNYIPKPTTPKGP